MKLYILPIIAALALAACTTTGTAPPETPVEKAAREFNEYVGKIVSDAYGDDPQVQAAILRNAVIELAATPQVIVAVDRQMRGAGYVYCRADCGNTDMALASCNLTVQKRHPGEMPHCALYAVDRQVVWTGPAPWE